MNLYFEIIKNFLLAAYAQGFVMALFVYVTRKTHYHKVFYLWIVIILLSLNALQGWMKMTGTIHYLGPFKYLYFPWYLFVMPYYSFFMESFVRRPEKKSLVFLRIAVVLFVLYFLTSVYINLTTPPDQVIERLVEFHKYDEVIGLIFFWVILISVIRLYYKHKETFKLYRNISWVEPSFWVGAILFSLWAVANYTQYYIQDEAYYFFYYTLRAMAALLIFAYAYIGLYRFMIDASDTWLPSKQKLSGKDKEKMIMSHIEKFIKERELYLDPFLSLNKLSEYIQMAPYRLSAIINNIQKEKFSNYINGFRVNKAIEIMKKDKEKNLTLEDVALQSGFSSRSNFYTHFKRIKGMTPKQFRDQLF